MIPRFDSKMYRCHASDRDTDQRFRMPAGGTIVTKVFHVLTNNVRRHRYRLAGGATVLTAVVCLTLLLSPRFDGRFLRGAAGTQIQLPVGAVLAASSSFKGEHQPDVPARGATDPHPQAAVGGSSHREIPIAQPHRPTPPGNHSSLRAEQRILTPPPAAISPLNPCDAKTFPKRPAENLEESFTWQKVSVDSTNTYVFSAHLDTRGSRRNVVIVALSSDYMGTSSVYACQIWFADAKTPAEVTTAEVTTHSETHGRKYAATFYTCNYLTNDTLPFAVSLVTRNSQCRSPSNVLRISLFNPRSTSIRIPSPEVVNFTVCVTPLNYDFDDFRLLVEMVELNRMFGAQRIFFYNHTTGSHVVPYMRSYETDGVVTVVPWRLPVGADVRGQSAPEPEVHYFGQVAALNDCLYRNLFRSRFVVMTDLDEIVVPRQHGTWMGMMESEGKTRGSDWRSSVASFHIRNVFFRTDYGEDAVYSGDATVRGLQLRSLLYTTREETTFPHGWRSKHIVNTQTVLLVGVHHIEGVLDYNRFSVLDVGENAAQLHHYRSWEGAETSRQPSKTDRYMHGFNATILSRVAGVHRTVASRFSGVLTIEELKANRTHS